MALSNSEIAGALGMSHSSVSRMRSGRRIASIETLQALVEVYDADPRRLLAAAAKAQAGDAKDWLGILEGLFGDEVDLKSA